MKKILNSFLAFCIAAVATAQDGDSATTYKPVELPSGYTSQLNVVYTKVKDWEGKLDLYLPAKDKGASPIVINIHGG
jgi:acetyl esterase/lipase